MVLQKENGVGGGGGGGGEFLKDIYSLYFAIFTAS